MVSSDLDASRRGEEQEEESNKPSSVYGLKLIGCRLTVLPLGESSACGRTQNPKRHEAGATPKRGSGEDVADPGAERALKEPSKRVWNYRKATMIERKRGNPSLHAKRAPLRRRRFTKSR